MSDPALVIAVTSLLALGVVVFVLFVRPQDLPAGEPQSPFAHLDERKGAIYENLRDLQFEYRLGKLSDDDYKNTKTDLQKELAAVLAEVDRVKLQLNGVPTAPRPAAPKTSASECPHCHAKFERDLKFCGECGKAMHA